MPQNSHSIRVKRVHQMPPEPQGRQSVALWRGHHCLIMLFPNDRIICYGSFDSFLVISLSFFLLLFPSLCLSFSLFFFFSQMKALVALRVNNIACSNVASGNSEISEHGRQPEGRCRKEWGWVGPEISEDRELQPIKMSEHAGCVSQTFPLKLEGFLFLFCSFFCDCIQGSYNFFNQN